MVFLNCRPTETFTSSFGISRLAAVCSARYILVLMKEGMLIMHSRNFWKHDPRNNVCTRYINIFNTSKCVNLVRNFNFLHGRIHVM